MEILSESSNSVASLRGQGVFTFNGLFAFVLVLWGWFAVYPFAQAFPNGRFIFCCPTFQVFSASFCFFLGYCAHPFGVWIGWVFSEQCWIVYECGDAAAADDYPSSGYGVVQGIL